MTSIVRVCGCVVSDEVLQFGLVNDQPCLFLYRPPEVLKEASHQPTRVSTGQVFSYLASASTLAFFASIISSASRLISLTSWVSGNPMLQYFGGVDGGAQLCLCLD